MQLHWIFHLYMATSAAVLVAALSSIVAAFMRRWSMTKRLGRASFLCALGVFASGVLFSTSMAFFGIGAVPVESKAAHLAKSISTFMNGTAMMLPAFVIGVVTWLVGIAGEQREAAKPE